MSLKLATLAVNTEADALLALANGGYLDLYDGTRPADADTPVTSQTRLASPRFGSPAFAAASGGVAVARPITADSNAAATGTSTWFRVTKADHATVLFDGSVGLAAASPDLVLDTVSIAAHRSVAITTFTYTIPKG